MFQKSSTSVDASVARSYEWQQDVFMYFSHQAHEIQAARFTRSIDHSKRCNQSGVERIKQYEYLQVDADAPHRGLVVPASSLH